MHSAPSVSYPVGRCRFAARLYAATWLVAAGTCAAWTALSPRAGTAHALAALTTVVLGVWLTVAWRRGPVGDLAWDGAGWQWRGQAGRPSVRLDLQGCLLLEWRGTEGGHAWMWLDQHRAGDRWMALRRAVYSPARTEASPQAQAPLAGP